MRTDLQNTCEEFILLITTLLNPFLPQAEVPSLLCDLLLLVEAVRVYWEWGRESAGQSGMLVH